MSEVAYEDDPQGPSPAIGMAGAVLVAVLGLGIALLGRPQLSLLTYVLVLVLGVTSIAVYRYLSMRRSLSTEGHVVTRRQRRMALVPVALVFLACGANAFVWASEVAKR